MNFYQHISSLILKYKIKMETLRWILKGKLEAGGIVLNRSHTPVDRHSSPASQVHPAQQQRIQCRRNIKTF